MKPSRQAISSLLSPFLARAWNGLTAPHATVTEVGARRQAQFLAVVSCLMLVMLFLQTSAALTSQRFELGLMLALLWAGVALVYGLSRTKSPQRGAVLLVYGFAFFAFALVNRRAADVNTTLYGMIPIAYLLGGVLLSVGKQIGLVGLVLVGSVVVGALRTVPGVNMNLLGGNLVALGVVLILTSKLRDGIERRRLDQLRQINRDLAATQTAVQESEQRFRAFVEQSTDGLILTDEQGTVIEQNLAHQKLTGVKREEILGQPIWNMPAAMMLPERQSADTRQRFQELIQDTLRTGQWPFVGQAREVEICRSDGTRADILQTTFLIKTEQGYRLGSISHDITERKQAEGKIRQRLDELAVVNAISQVAASQLELSALLEQTGEKLRQVLDMHTVYIALYDAPSSLISFPYWREGPETVQRPAIPLGAGLTSIVIRTRQPLVINRDYERRSAELGVVRRLYSHNLLLTKSWLGVPMQVGEQVIGVLSAQSIEHEDAFADDDVRLWTTIAANVSIAIQNAQLYKAVQQELAERKQTEAALRESQTMLKLIFEYAFDGISVYEELLDQGARRLIDCNARYAEIAGRSRDELLALGNTLPLQTSVDGPADRQQFIDRLNAGVYAGRFSWHRPDRRDNVVEYAAVSLRQAGRLLVIGVDRDITEQVRAAREREALIQELQAKNAELERFTYTVSHDLKSPLVTIRGFLGFVEKDALAGHWDRVRADMARITEATDKMQRLLGELLELSRIGRMMNAPQTVAFEAIVREALDLVRGRIEARGVQVVVAPDLPAVQGDHARLVEVVQNLVDNACKFMGEQAAPRIEIGVRSARGTDEPGRPILFVRDNGIGIAPQYHERIFGLFDKLDAQTEGTGVGLALVKRIVEVHRGRIWVESESGQGATFYFTLPTAPAEVSS